MGILDARSSALRYNDGSLIYSSAHRVLAQRCPGEDYGFSS
jgi:hypothetical protein